MKRTTEPRDPARAVVNTLLVVAFLVIAALAKSEFGGPDSVFNSANVAFVSLFFVLNFHFDRQLSLAFAFPLLFLFISVVANAGALQSGSINAAIATALGLGLFMIKPVSLDHRLLRALLAAALVVGLALSIKLSIERQAIDFTQEIANANFNINPNGAAIFFFQCLVISILVVQGPLGWVLAVPAILLTVTTGSRAGTISTVLLLVGYSLMSRRPGTTQLSQKLFERARAIWLVIFVAVTAIVAIQQFIPDAADFLLLRFEVNSSREAQWNAGLEGIASLRELAIGTGPATLGARTADASHSSYIDAIGNSGVFFLISILAALLVWLRRMVNEGSSHMLWILPTILVHGAVEAILFNGLSTLWLLLMVLGIIFRSRATMADAVSAPVTLRVASSQPPVRRLVRGTR